MEGTKSAYKRILNDDSAVVLTVIEILGPQSLSVFSLRGSQYKSIPEIQPVTFAQLTRI
jgi:hypothetical protein